MNKKFVALLTLAGTSALLTGCGANMKVDNFRNNVNDFKQNIAAYCKINSEKANKIVFNKYKLALNVPDATLVDAKAVEPNESLKEDTNQTQITETVEEITPNENKNENLNQLEEQNKTEISTKNADNVSTLYSLTCDVDDECENFTTLKNKLNDAILETQNLIDKVNKKEIELTPEQRMLITEQSQQLKSLGRKLSHVTTELSINLSDLANLMRENGDLDNISLKYLVVLDNLINGNEMLENGLQSLNLMNGMFKFGGQLPPNNGRIVYGFRKNNEPPVIRDYSIDENGNVTENNSTDNAANDTQEIKTDESTNANNKKLQSNIDTYNNGFSNIDSFFNTALLDNEFMYGNNRFGGGGFGPMGGYGGGFNPYYANQYADKNEYQANENKTINSVDNTNNTQDIDSGTKQTSPQKTKKNKGFVKNIDTYKKDSSAKILTKLNNFKTKVSNMFRPKKDEITRPIYKYEKED